MRFCDKLPKQRKNNNFSKEQLADKLGVSRQAVSKWESGISYPDMDKIIQMCKILNCKLEDLLDDGVIKESEKDSKININTYLQDFLSFITKIYNMFASMTFKQKIKFIFEIFLIVITILIIGGIFYLIINEITFNILEIIPFNIKHQIDMLLESVYVIILIVLGTIILIHLLKLRYLDYFITIEDQNVSERTIEKSIDQKENKYIKEKKREKIIIRDPKHSSLSLFNLLAKIIVISIKLFITIIIIPVIFFFVFLIILGIISFSHIIYNKIFFWISIGLLSSSILCYIIIYFVYNFIFNKTIKFKQSFIIIITSLVMIGISTGLTITTSLNCKYVEPLENISTYTKKIEFQVTENTALFLALDIDKDNIQYNIDNSLNNVIVEITSIKGIDYSLDKSEEIYILDRNTNFYNIYNIIINDFKRNIIRNYDSSNLLKIKISMSQKDYDILHINHNQITMNENKR